MRWVLVFLILPINILCQQYDPQIQKHIKPDFYKLSELLTSNGGCKFLNKDSTSFTGTAYEIEYVSDYYFLSNNSVQDTITCRIKIIPFKNGFRDGVSQIIDPYFYPESSLSDEFIDIKFDINDIDTTESQKQIIFIFNHFYIEHGDLSQYISFGDYAFYNLNGDKLENMDTEILGDEWSKELIASEDYKSKYLKLEITEEFSETGEQYGHYESDYELFYYSVPPYYCGKSINISNFEILEKFKTKHPHPASNED